MSQWEPHGRAHGRQRGAVGHLTVAEACSRLPGRSCFFSANAHLYQLDFLLCATSILARAFIMTALLSLADC
jgi:hypothetical protein